MINGYNDFILILIVFLIDLSNHTNLLVSVINLHTASYHIVCKLGLICFPKRRISNRWSKFWVSNPRSFSKEANNSLRAKAMGRTDKEKVFGGFWKCVACWTDGIGDEVIFSPVRV